METYIYITETEAHLQLQTGRRICYWPSTVDWSTIADHSTVQARFDMAEAHIRVFGVHVRLRRDAAKQRVCSISAEHKKLHKLAQHPGIAK